MITRIRCPVSVIIACDYFFGVFLLVFLLALVAFRMIFVISRTFVISGIHLVCQREKLQHKDTISLF
jgi:hypothetical protein